MAELITGNPWQKNKDTYSHPASYTRFLLPFSYTLNTAALKADQLCFQQRQAKDFARERLFYFTAETANVLFQRAIWAEIDAALWRKKGMVARRI